MTASPEERAALVEDAMRPFLEDAEHEDAKFAAWVDALPMSSEDKAKTIDFGRRKMQAALAQCEVNVSAAIDSVLAKKYGQVH